MNGRGWFGALTLGFLVAQFVMGQGSPGKVPPYDADNEVTLRGKVVSVAAIPDWMGKNGVNITIQTLESTIVHVDTAPAEFFSMLDFEVAEGDDLEVTGVWANWGGSRVLLARIVTRQKVAVSMRDLEGRPVW